MELCLPSSFFVLVWGPQTILTFYLTLVLNPLRLVPQSVLHMLSLSKIIHGQKLSIECEEYGVMVQSWSLVDHWILGDW